MPKDCFYKHTLNVLVNHHLENVEILSSFFMPIKQEMQKNMLYSIQGQGLQGCTTWSISFVRKSGQMAGLDLFGMRVTQGGRGYRELLSSLLHCKSLLCVDSRSGCFVRWTAPGYPVLSSPQKSVSITVSGAFLRSCWVITHPQLRICWSGCGCTRCKQWFVIGLLET